VSVHDQYVSVSILDLDARYPTTYSLRVVNTSYYFKLNIHINPSFRHYIIRAFEKECIDMEEKDLTRVFADIPQTGYGNYFRIA
jgi:hypothetical protein